MTKENKFKIGLCLQGIALSMDEITLKANEDRIKLIEDIIIAEPTEDTISRADAIDACEQSYNLLEAVDRIKEL
jgi:hypothetical protein